MGVFISAQIMGLTGISLKPKGFFPTHKETDSQGLRQSQMQYLKALMVICGLVQRTAQHDFRPTEIPTRNLEPLTHLLNMQVNYESREMTPGLKLNYNEKRVLFDYYSICLTKS